MERKFARRRALSADDRSALRTLPFQRQSVPPHGFILREGEPSRRCALIHSGLAYRNKTTAEGMRQIVSIHIPGDMVDLQGALLKIADHNVQALTPCEMIFIDRQAVADLILSHPTLGMAMWVDTLIDGSIFREWIVNVGRRDAHARIEHLLCELGTRFEMAGLSDRDGFDLPMTQEQIADSVGLTPVHVNRVLKSLGGDRLIQRNRRYIRIPDWQKLTDVAGFNERYLHLDQATV